MKRVFGLLLITIVIASIFAIGLSAQSAFATATDISSPSSGSTQTSKPLTFSGHTVTDGRIDLKEDGVTIATTQADVNGVWTITTSNVKSGTHSYTAFSTSLDFNFAFMDGQAEGTIEEVDVNNHEFLDTIQLPSTASSTDLVVRGSILYVPVAEDQYNATSIHCSILEYQLPQLTLVRSVTLPDHCSAGSIDVNDAGTMAVVSYQNYDQTSYHIAAVNLTNNTIIDDFDTEYTMTDGIVFSKDQQSFFIRIGGGVAQYHLVNNAIELVNGQGYGQDFSPAIAVDPVSGKVAIAEVGNGAIRLINPNDLNDTSLVHVADDATTFSRVAYSHDGSKIMVVGQNNDGNHVWEINTSTGLVANDYSLPNFPESVGYTPDGSQYVIGDNFGSGTIFFGTPGGSNYTDTIAQSDRSYAMRNTNFIYSFHGTDTSDPVSITNSFVSASYGTDPNGNISTKTVAPGGTVDVSGSGYQANSDVTITLHSSPVVLKTIKTNSSGAFSTSVTIPKTTTLGAHTLEISGKDAAGNNVSSILSLTIVTLPATGNNSSSDATFALVLIAGGFVLARRKRRALLS